nr:MAG TPA: hypothetical protein [Caudoviricetes sp.]
MLSVTKTCLKFPYTFISLFCNLYPYIAISDITIIYFLK